MKHVIVIADPAGGNNPALKRALQMQRATRTRITLLGFCYANIGNTTDLALAKLSRKDLEAAVIKRREKELRDTLKKFGVTTRQVRITVMWSKEIKAAITAFCRQQKDAILIKSTSRTHSWLHTSTDWQLIRECPIPVMLSAGKTWKKSPRILAAVDFATTSKSKQRLNDKIVEHARALAKQLDEELHLGFAITVPEVLADLDLINPRQYASEKRKQLAPIIEAFCNRHKLNPANVHLRQGPAEKVIPSIANKLKADLVVTGTVGRKGIRGKLIGNTAEAILANLYTDILTIKP